jgi:hypothetical protein
MRPAAARTLRALGVSRRYRLEAATKPRLNLRQRFEEESFPRRMVTISTKFKRRPRSSCHSWQAFCALFVIGATLFTAATQSAVADPLAVKVGVIHEAHSRETISIVDIPPADDFIAGARMAMDDNNTTGRFLDQSFSVVDAKLSPGEDPIAALKGMLDDGVRFFIVDLPPAEVLAVADAARPQARWCSTRALPMSACARRIAAPTLSTPPRRVRC